MMGSRQNDEKRKRSNKTQRSDIFGDKNFVVDSIDIVDEATWGEVVDACCLTRHARGWLITVGTVAAVLFFLYFFLLALDLMGDAARVVTSCGAGRLFNADYNPFVGVMIGLLTTACLQSSSTTTAVVVTLVGAGAVSIENGIFLVMGANIGTAVTSTIVAMGQIRNIDAYERAFACAIVHDMFNILTVVVLLPLEIVTGFLFTLSKNLVQGVETTDSEKFIGPVKKLVAPIADKIIISNKSVIKKIALGSVCEDMYPIECEPGKPTYETCSRVGLIRCNKKTGDCPLFFRDNASQTEDVVSGYIVLFLSMALLFVCVTGICYCTQKLVHGYSSRIIHKIVDINGYFALSFGAGVTMLVQSSSMFTSAFTPLAGIGILQLEQCFPLTLGANIGTTLSSLMVAYSTKGTNALQVAFTHVFFNVVGFLLWYPIPFMRKFPVEIARKLGASVRLWRPIAIFYVVFVFYAIPAIVILINFLHEEGGPLYTFLWVLLCIVLTVLLPAFIVWWSCLGGGVRFQAWAARRRERRKEAREELPLPVDRVEVLPFDDRSNHSSLFECEQRVTPTSERFEL